MAGVKKIHQVIGGKVRSLVNGYLEGIIFTNYKKGKGGLGTKKKGPTSGNYNF